MICLYAAGMTQAQPPMGPRWWVHIAFVSGGVVAGLVAFAVAYWWFSARSGDSGQYDVVRSAVAATGVITVGAGAAVALRRQKTNEDDSARARAAHILAERNTELARQNMKLAQDNMALTQRSVEATLQKLALEEDANRTDRYTQAVEQLGSDSIHVRLGGIYALKRLCDDSQRDLPTIVEVLAAFIRATTSQAEALDRNRITDEDDEYGSTPAATDVMAALRVLAQINSATPSPIDLTNAYLPRTNLGRLDLPGADLSGANLSWSNLGHSILSHAQLFGARMEGAYLVGTMLDHAILTGADLKSSHLNGVTMDHAFLEHATLSRAQMLGASMVGAEIKGTSFDRAQFSGVDLAEANISHVDFSGLDLSDVNFEGTTLSTVTWDEGTVWPDQFIPPASLY